MTLFNIKPGESYIVDKIYLKDSIVLRPMTLGLVEGCEVKCLTKFADLLELELYGNRLAITKETAKRYGCTKLDK